MPGRILRLNKRLAMPPVSYNDWAPCELQEVTCRMGGEAPVVLWPDLKDAELSNRLSALRSKSAPPLALRHGWLPQDIVRAADEAKKTHPLPTPKRSPKHAKRDTLKDKPTSDIATD